MRTQVSRPAIEGETVIDVFLDLIAHGASPPVAATVVGISRSTYFRWMQQANDRRAPAHIRQFGDQVERARAAWVVRLSIAVTAGIPRHPALGVKLLRQLDPEGPWDIDGPPAQPMQPARPARLPDHGIPIPWDRLDEGTRTVIREAMSKARAG